MMEAPALRSHFESNNMNCPNPTSQVNVTLNGISAAKTDSSTSTSTSTTATASSTSMEDDDALVVATRKSLTMVDVHAANASSNSHHRQDDNGRTKSAVSPCSPSTKPTCEIARTPSLAQTPQHHQTQPAIAKTTSSSSMNYDSNATGNASPSFSVNAATASIEVSEAKPASFAASEAKDSVDVLILEQCPLQDHGPLQFSTLKETLPSLKEPSVFSNNKAYPASTVASQPPSQEVGQSMLSPASTNDDSAQLNTLQDQKRKDAVAIHSGIVPTLAELPPELMTKSPPRKSRSRRRLQRQNENQGNGLDNSSSSHYTNASGMDDHSSHSALSVSASSFHQQHHQQGISTRREETTLVSSSCSGPAKRSASPKPRPNFARLPTTPETSCSSLQCIDMAAQSPNIILKKSTSYSLDTNGSTNLNHKNNFEMDISMNEEDLDKKPAAITPPLPPANNNMRPEIKKIPSILKMPGSNHDKSKNEESVSSRGELHVSFSSLPSGHDDLPASATTTPKQIATSSEDGDQKPAATTSTMIARPTAIASASRCRSEPPASTIGCQSNNGTTNIPTPRGRRGGAGLGARRAVDRENRRQQIRERMSSFDSTDDSPSVNNGTATNRLPRGTRTPPTTTVTRLPARSASAVEPGGCYNRASNSPANEPSLQMPALARSATAAASAASPAPGDNLTGRPATRFVSRQRSTDDGKAASNPSADAYEQQQQRISRAAVAAEAAATANTLSEKQRLRRQEGNDSNTPASIRPGAYKEIPGRGLVRNDTLRFSIITAIQKQSRSLRNMFGRSSTSSRNCNTMVGSSNLAVTEEKEAEEGDETSESMQNNSRSSDHRDHVAGRVAPSRDLSHDSRSVSTASHGTARRASRVSRGLLETTSHTAQSRSARSIGSIPSVLVDEEDYHRSYVGNVSFRSLSDAQEQGILTVARPVFLREPSTLEALCIIPGDLAVAVALDGDLNETVQSNIAARRELMGLNATSTIAEADTVSQMGDDEECEMASPRPSHGKRTKPRSKRFMPKPSGIRKLFKPKRLASTLNPKKLLKRNPGAGRDVQKSKSIEEETPVSRPSLSMARDRNRQSSCSQRSSVSARRHSF